MVGFLPPTPLDFDSDGEEVARAAADGVVCGLNEKIPRGMIYFPAADLPTTFFRSSSARAGASCTGFM